MRSLDTGDAGLALVMGALAGSYNAAIGYHRRVKERAPFAVKATAGAVLAAAAVAVGLMFHLVWRWVQYPDVVIGIGAIGSAVFPFALFKTVRRAVTPPKHPGRRP